MRAAEATAEGKSCFTFGLKAGKPPTAPLLPPPLAPLVPTAEVAPGDFMVPLPKAALLMLLLLTTAAAVEAGVVGDEAAAAVWT